MCKAVIKKRSKEGEWNVKMFANDQKEKNLNKNILLTYLLSFVYRCFTCMYIYAQYQVSTICIYRHFQASLQVLGIKSRSSWQAGCALNHWAISSFPKSKLPKLWDKWTVLYISLSFLSGCNTNVSSSMFEKIKNYKTSTKPESTGVCVVFGYLTWILHE